ncbi:MAG: ankyrin repeat domain-containing protein, partial [Gammaproteobacteria bacterium]
HFAARNGHLEIVKLLLDKGADVKEKNSYGETILYLVAGNDHLEMVNLLLTKGADVNEKNEYGSTALHGAAAKGQLEIVKLLLEKGADVKEKDDKGNTALHFAARNGHLEIVKLLLDKGADVKEKDNDGNTALYRAVEQGHLNIVQYLIALGADVNEKAKGAKTVFYHAIKTKKLAIVKCIGECGPILPWQRIDLSNVYSWNTELFPYVERLYLLSKPTLTSEELEVQKFTQGELNIRFDEDKINGYYEFNSGKSALHYAVMDNRMSVALDLLSRGARLDLPDASGKTVADKLRLDQIELLLRYLPKKIIELKDQIEQRVLPPENHSRITIIEQLIITIGDLQFKKLQQQQFANLQAKQKFAHDRHELREQIKLIAKDSPIYTIKFQIQQHMRATASEKQFSDKLFGLLKRMQEPGAMLNLNSERSLFNLFKSKNTREPYSVNALLFKSINDLIKDTEIFIKEYEKNNAYSVICADMQQLQRHYQQALASLCQTINEIRKNTNISDEECQRQLSELSKVADTVSSIVQSRAYLKEVSNKVHYQYLDKEKKYYPAIEHLVASFYNILSGGEHGIAPTEIVRFQGLDYQKTAIATLSVDGAFPSKLLSYVGGYNLNHFDFASFSTAVFVGLLLKLQGAYASNYIVKVVWENVVFRGYIVGINNNFVFAKPVDMTNVFFFFPQMQKPVYPPLRESLINRP